MCGIAGVVVPENARVDELRSALQRMRGAQHHRGPDDAGTQWDDHVRVGLAACRLSIRDLTPAGHMPMCASGVCITYNGEIYNAEQLRDELKQHGHVFRSHSDTEVILRGYLQWKQDVVVRLRGMFAFAILDAPARLLVLARDPLGIKPLYYSQTAPFCFASELRALTDARMTSRVIDDVALSAYLQLGSIPAPLTIYRDIAALPPGHLATLRLGDGELRLRRYWSLDSEPTQQATVPDVKTALEEAVASHLVADVPVGAFLSGGLDSSAVVALAMRASDAPLRTCSIAFESREHDESGYARAVAKALGTEHHERLVTRNDFLGGVGDFICALDQPSIDGFNTYFVSQTASELGLKVALSGLGGDELFGGYPSFRGVPRLVRALKTSRVLAGSGAATALRAVTRSDRWRKVAEAARRPANAASAFLVYRGLFTRGEASEMLRAPDPFDATAYVNDRSGAQTGVLAEWVGRAELGTYTASQLLRDADAMSMAHSLELRVPLLDTRLIETVNALPASQRFRGSGTKPLLRSLIQDELPQIVLDRKQRQGFTFPLQEWLAADDARDLWQWDAPIMRYFRRSELNSLQQRYRAGQTHWSRVWAMIALNEWSRRVAHA
jgi:asparagine synthase (glutamine-hydrolysing)